MGNIQESERRQLILRKVDRVCWLCTTISVCAFFVLSILDLYGVQINFSNSPSLRFVTFSLITGLFMVANEVSVYIKTISDDDASMGRFIRDLIVMWSINVFVLCCVHNYIYGSTFSHVLPVTLSVAIIIAGAQCMCYVIYHSYYERKEQMAINMMLKQQNAADSESPSATDNPSQCVLHSDYGGQELVINPRNVVYVESVANYADVCYMADGQVTHSTLRTTIKQLKDDLQGNGFIIQCHRGFLVNMHHVESLDGSQSRFYLTLRHTDKKIPVSRTHKLAIKEALA